MKGIRPSVPSSFVVRPSFFVHHLPVNRPKHLHYLRACFHGYGARIAGTLIFLALARLASTVDPVFLKKIIDGITAHSPLRAVMGAIPVHFSLKGATSTGEFLGAWPVGPVEGG